MVHPMQSFTRALALAFVLASFAVIVPYSAFACSCPVENPFVRLEDADAAFVGELLSRPVDGELDNHGTLNGIYEFQVEQTVKGVLPDIVQVVSQLDGASCGFNAGVGQRVGIFLNKEGDRWTGGACTEIDPDVLLALVQRQPLPDGEGPIVALAGASEPGIRTLALDENGRTLAYGAGEGQVTDFAICPGSRRAVEYSLYRESGDSAPRRILSVRDLAGFHIVWETTDDRLTIDGLDIACLDVNGSDLLLLAGDRIDRISDGDITELASLVDVRGGCPGFGSFDPTTAAAYFTGGQDCRGLYRYSLSTGDSELVGKVSPDSGINALVGIAPGPGGRYLAVEAHPGTQPLTFRLLMFDLSTEPAMYTEAAFGGPFEPHTMAWLSEDRFLLTGTAESLDTGLILNPDLETTATINGIWGGTAGTHGSDVYVLAPYGRLVHGPASGGHATMLREFSDPTIWGFATVSEEIWFDPSLTQADNLALLDAASTGRDDSGREMTGILTGAAIITLLATTGTLLLVRSRRAGRPVAS